MANRVRKSRRAHSRSAPLPGLGSLFGRANAVILYLKGAPLFGLIGVALVAYFQYLSNYESKVRDVSKDDLGAATDVFIDISNKIAGAMTLQEMLFFTFAATKPVPSGSTDNSLLLRTAPELYKSYSNSRTELRQDIAVYARRAEIFIDWPSDLDRDAAKEKKLLIDPIGKSGIADDKSQRASSGLDVINLIGAYNFDCDNMLPESSDLRYLGEVTLPRPQNLDKDPATPAQIVINWGSLKHQLVTLQYCFERIHDKLKPARTWAAAIGAQNAIAHPDYGSDDAIREKLDLQVARFNAFVALAMRRIQEIRIRYRPNGFLCYVPGVRELGDWLKKYKFGRGCSPIHYAARSAVGD